MRGVIAGFGKIAMGHMGGYANTDELVIVAVVDISPERRLVAEREFGLRAYASFDEMLDRESPDFLDICSPPNTHRQYIRQALASGIHVLCEKPVFLAEDDGYGWLLGDLMKARSVLYPSHNYKFAPILSLMQKVVREPDFGDVICAHFRTLRSQHATGVSEWNPHWRRDRSISGGGILRDHGPHSIYLATNLTGRKPVAVSCLTGNLRRDQYDDTEDTALLTIQCEDGVQVVLDMSWTASFRNSYYSVMGSSGGLVVENDNISYSLHGNMVRRVLHSDFDDPSHQAWFHPMFLDFADMIRRPERQAELIREALMTSVVIDSAYVSADEGGRWIKVEVPAVKLPSAPV